MTSSWTISVGVPTAGKAINLSQLQAELAAAGVDVATGLGMAGGMVYRIAADGELSDFAAEDEPTAEQAVADHVAMRDKTDAEYATEFQEPETTAVRKQEIRDITAGLLPREQVPMT
jgi:hypothetical protein